MKPLTPSQALMMLETEWYRTNGLFKDRIVTDRDGIPYPAGDWSWNRQHPHRQEFIEERMKQDGVYR